MQPGVTEEKFKLALATDLVIYMIKLWTKNSDEPQVLINELLNAWSQKITASADYMKNQFAEQMAEQQEDISVDVATILLDINNTENVILKGEFKSQMREAIFKGLNIEAPADK